MEDALPPKMLLDLTQNPYDHELIKKMAEDNGFLCESLNSHHLEFHKYVHDERAEEPIGKVHGWRFYCRPPNSGNYIVYHQMNYPQTSKVFEVTLGTFNDDLLAAHVRI